MKAKTQSQRSDTGKRAATSTRTTLLRTAERLVADHGFAAVGVRDIISEASANLGAINYHFGSKTALLDTIFEERSAELSRARFRGLKQVLEEHDRPAPLPAILNAFFRPVVYWLYSEDEYQFAIKFCARARLEGTPRMKDILNTMFDVHWRFSDAIAEARPELEPPDIYWRMFFALGMEHESITSGERLKGISRGTCETSDPDEVLDKLVSAALLIFS